MKLYLNDKAYDVPLHTKLTPALYEIVTPLLQELANTRGAQSAVEQDIMEKVFASPELAQKIDLTKGADAFESMMGDARFQEIIKIAYLKIRNRLFEVINIDKETIPKIFAFAKACIDTNKITDSELLAHIQSEIDSEFWNGQDIDGMLNDLEFFRSSVCRRIRIV
jgi:RNase adaptor protein for sRNA GlmZ degradation